MMKKIMLFFSMFLCFGMLTGCSPKTDAEFVKTGWDSFSSTEQLQLQEYGLNKEMIDLLCEEYPGKCSMIEIEKEMNSIDKETIILALKLIKSELEQYIYTKIAADENIEEYTVDFSRGRVALEEIGHIFTESYRLPSMPSYGTLTVDKDFNVSSTNIVYGKFNCQYVSNTFECE